MVHLGLILQRVSTLMGFLVFQRKKAKVRLVDSQINHLGKGLFVCFCFCFNRGGTASDLKTTGTILEERYKLKRLPRVEAKNGKKSRDKTGGKRVKRRASLFFFKQQIRETISSGVMWKKEFGAEVLGKDDAITRE